MNITKLKKQKNTIVDNTDNSTHKFFLVELILKLKTPLINEILEVVFVGIPFSIFKIVSGQLILDKTDQNILQNNILYICIIIFAYIIVSWGIVDFILNLTNLFFLLIKKKRVVPICLLTKITTTAITFKLKNDNKNENKNSLIYLGTSLDAFFSLTIVCILLGGGFLSMLSPASVVVWNTATVFNIMWAGISRAVDSVFKIETL